MALQMIQNENIRETIEGKRVITKKPELLAPAKPGKIESGCPLRGRCGIYRRPGIRLAFQRG